MAALKQINGVPGWATEFLRHNGYVCNNTMDEFITNWWGWYQAENSFYDPMAGQTFVRRDAPNKHLSLRPARAVAEEWATLVMDEKTQISAEDAALNTWLEERFGDFVGEQADNLALAFALGTGAWSCNYEGVEGSTKASIVFHDAGNIIPLLSDGSDSVSCAFTDCVLVDGRMLDRLQVHEPVEGTYHVRTWLFDPKNHNVPVECESVTPDLDTRCSIPTYALVRPAIANTYVDASPLGVSVFNDGIDAIKCVDEAFDRSYWMLRLCQPRVMVDETAVKRNVQTGEVELSSTLDQRMFRPVKTSGVGGQTPLTVYAPDLQADATDASINSALSLMSFKCGFGPNYFSYSRQQGLRTATEVSSDNSQLFRNVRKHEQQVGKALKRLFAGAYASECALCGLAPTSVDVDITWDDSIVEDTATERQQMKDDIARGLAPAWLYPMRFYGMSEDEARVLVGATPELPEEA